MEKILVMLYVPALEKVYDIWIPAHKKIYNIIKLLVKAVNEMNDYGYVTDSMPLLYNKITAKQYDLNSTVKDTDIRNGTEIVLI